MFDRSKMGLTNVPGVFVFPPMPGDLDPNTALTITLIKHGILWRRPTEKDHPATHSAWNKAFAAGLAKKHVVSHITPLPERIHRPAPFAKPFDGLCTPSSSWSGARRRDPWPDWPGVRTVVGTWVVPTVSRPTWSAGLADGKWISSSWIGLGGDPEAVDSPPLLQAGITQDVDESGTPVYYAWYAFDFAEHKIDNFVVRAQDEVNFSVQYQPNGNWAIITGLNVTTGNYHPLAFQLDESHIPGSSVEWIVEVPGGGYAADHVIPQMPPVTFTSAIGCNGEAILANSDRDRCYEIWDRTRQVNRVDFGSTPDSFTITLV